MDVSRPEVFARDLWLRASLPSCVLSDIFFRPVLSCGYHTLLSTTAFVILPLRTSHPASQPKSLPKGGNWRFAQLAEFLPYFLTERVSGMWKRRTVNDRIYIYLLVGRDSSVGIATRYWLDGLGIEFRRGRDFPRPSRPVLGLTQPPIQWVPGLFSGGTAAGAWRWAPTPSSAEVKE